MQYGALVVDGRLGRGSKPGDSNLSPRSVPPFATKRMVSSPHARWAVRPRAIAWNQQCSGAVWALYIFHRLTWQIPCRIWCVTVFSEIRTDNQRLGQVGSQRPTNTLSSAAHARV